MPSPNRSAAAPASTHQRTSRFCWSSGLLALLCILVGIVIARHYPLAQPLVPGAFALVAIVSFVRQNAWLVFVPALLPIIGFAPWTGWITFEESDLLVLAVATGGYARLAWRSPADVASRSHDAASRSRAAALIGLTIALFAASTLLAMMRGFTDAGGFSFGWFQGYREPMNSLRLAKPFFAALLLLPLWAAVHRGAPEQAAHRLSLGLMLGLLGVSLAAVWERLAFTDLLNFSTDYRTTALFWEMHVGGAALDGFLALTVPFAVREMLLASTKARWLLAAAATALGTYACLTTFSRGVYLAVPVGVGVMVMLHAAQQRRMTLQPTPNARRSTVPRLALLAGFMLAAAWMFPRSGYRGMLALMGALVVLLPLAEPLRRSARAERVAGAALGIVFSLLACAFAWLLPRGPYVVYAMGVLFTLSVLGLQRRSTSRRVARYAVAFALGAYLWVLTGVALVALHWGGEAALWQALPVVAALLLSAVVVTRFENPVWPQELRWQGNTVGAVVVASGMVAAFGGGAYMGERFSNTNTDFAGRLSHWELSLAMLGGTERWLLGKGLGRYVESYAIAAPESLRPGDYRLQLERDNRYFKIASGGQLTGDPNKPVVYGGDTLRLTQRVALPAGLPRVDLRVRASEPAWLVVGLCTKHLLYHGDCIGSKAHVKPKPGEWQSLRLQLEGKPLSRGAWYAPQLVAFVLFIDDPAKQLEIDDVALTGIDGHELLSNGDFSADMAHWFFTSDRSHLPWHAKNLALHSLFDQGLIGLALLGAMGAGALWRLSFGSARAHALAPGLAGALVGFVTVGLFDSLLDVPRVAFVFYFLLLAALGLRSAPAAAIAGMARHRARPGIEANPIKGSESGAYE